MLSILFRIVAEGDGDRQCGRDGRMLSGGRRRAKGRGKGWRFIICKYHTQDQMKEESIRKVF
jgi:hypothetical protein